MKYHLCLQQFSGRSSSASSYSSRGAGDTQTQQQRVAELEGSHKKEKKNNAKLKEVVQELKDRFLLRN